MTLNKSDGSTEEIEIVMTLKLENINNNDYVIYKSKDKYFGARYLEENGNTELITDLSDIEKKSLSELFDKLNNGEMI